MALRDPETGNEYDDEAHTDRHIANMVSADRETARIMADLEEVDGDAPP